MHATRKLFPWNLDFTDGRCCARLARIERQSADDTSEMVFADDAENVGHDRTSVVSCTSRHVFARATQECRQPCRWQRTCFPTTSDFYTFKLTHRWSVMPYYGRWVSEWNVDIKRCNHFRGTWMARLCFTARGVRTSVMLYGFYPVCYCSFFMFLCTYVFFFFSVCSVSVCYMGLVAWNKPWLIDWIRYGLS